MTAVAAQAGDALIELINDGYSDFNAFCLFIYIIYIIYIYAALLFSRFRRVIEYYWKIRDLQPRMIEHSKTFIFQSSITIT